MSTRTRAGRQLQADADALTIIDKLLLAQATYEYGANAWLTIAHKLANHALVSRPTAFTPQVRNALR